MKVTMDRYNATGISLSGMGCPCPWRGRKFQSASDAVRTFYEEDRRQLISIARICYSRWFGNANGTIMMGMLVIFFNFRGDRAIEISRASPRRNSLNSTEDIFPDIFYAGMMEYDGDAHIPPHFLVQPPAIDRVFSEYLCAEKVKTFAISETDQEVSAM